MMQAAHIPLGHLYSSGVQPQHEYSQQEDEMINLLFNKDQYLQDQQNAQVGALTAKVVLPEITPDLQWKALQDIKNYEDKVKALYVTQKDRRKLSSENLLQAQRLKNELDFSLSAYHQNTANFDSTMKSIDDMVGRGILTPEEGVSSVEEYKRNAADRNIKSNADMPLLSAIVAKYTGPRIKAEDEIKKATARTALRDKVVAQINQGQDNQLSYDIGKRDRLATSVDPRDIELAFGDIEKAKQFAADSWIKGKVSGGGAFSINMGGGKDKYPPVIEDVGGVVYHNFSGHPAQDMHGNITGKYTSVKVNPDGTAEVFMTQAVDSKGNDIDTSGKSWEDFMKNTGAKSDPNMKGGVWLPYTKSVEGVLQGHDIITKNIKVKKYGRYTASSSNTATPVGNTSTPSKVWRPK